jgi:hypothetical protein
MAGVQHFDLGVRKGTRSISARRGRCNGMSALRRNRPAEGLSPRIA